MDEKPVVVVGPNYGGEKPRIAIRFYLDTPTFKRALMRMAAEWLKQISEPPAAMNVLAHKIMEAQSKIDKMQGKADERTGNFVEPYLTVATFCDRTMVEKDGVMSIMRVVDTFEFAHPDFSDPSRPPALSLQLVLQFRGGPCKETATLTVKGPADERYETAKVDLELDDTVTHATTNGRIIVPFYGYGRYSLTVSIGARSLINMPFRVQETIPQRP